jgi:hypothetical protein
MEVDEIIGDDAARRPSLERRRFDDPVAQRYRPEVRRSEWIHHDRRF